MTDHLKIGELPKKADCPVQTIRYYEQAGLLPQPNRSEGNYRLYDERHIERLSFIRHCRTLDMALEEIRTFLAFRDIPEKNCAGVNALLDEHIKHVAERIGELKLLEKQLKALRRLCNQTNAMKDCGILNELAAEVTGARQRRKTSLAHGHVHGAHKRGKNQS